ncbi:hypothetical protein MA16_Dca010870 [Dendrobium catenatum]|uniref:Uncharacterized protein n=1 Tax=Dendrobium catenatum TaxID=906689 RepID=A0A2I0XFG9_9ASPA|nr:hypothetical protein MA16_Dca010870 [Dendrobium catenatum]
MTKLRIVLMIILQMDRVHTTHYRIKIEDPTRSRAQEVEERKAARQKPDPERRELRVESVEGSN